MIDATPILRAVAARRRARLARQDAVAAQRQVLRHLVRTAAATRFGREHGFDRIRDVPDFQARVPLRNYEAFWETYWRPTFPVLDNVGWPGRVPFFAMTSGTTVGRSKYVPITKAMIRQNTGAGLDLFAHHLAARPRSRIMGGRLFMLGGSTDLTVHAHGIASGDISGIMAVNLPWYGRPFRFPPLDIALMADWEAKIDRIVDRVPQADIRLISGTPSWLLILFDALAARHGKPLAELFPNLEMVVHGGVAFTPYRNRFETLLAGTGAELREVYPASEGFVAVADRGAGDGLRLIVDSGLFLEFVPEAELTAPNPTRHWLGTAETGVNYALVLSTCGGLWGYVLGDTVRLVDRDPPRVLITGRTRQTLSAFGEHLIVEQLDAAVAAAATAIGIDVTDFTVAPILPEETGAVGHHLFVVEPGGDEPGADAQARFAETIDQVLAAQNADYRTHRAEGFGMGAPRVRWVPPGSFAGWMKRRGRLGGQNKVPRVLTDPAQIDEIGP